MDTNINTTREWLEADGLGGFASGTVAGIRTRRYHALLLTGQNGPTGRRVLVNGFDAEIETPAGVFALSSQYYTPDVVHPNGVCRIQSFSAEPWPCWIFALDDGTVVSQEIFVPRGLQAIVITWRLVSEARSAKLRVRPFLSGRDYHSLHHENDAFRFDAVVDGEVVTWKTYEDVPAVHALTNAQYNAAPDWYRNFLYTEEMSRGLDATEDLAVPGVFNWELDRAEAVMILAGDSAAQWLKQQDLRAKPLSTLLGQIEARRRESFPSPLHRAADAYLVKRGAEQTIIAGYPWFTDWGRDTFIALRGLCIATGRLDEAKSILLSWVSSISRGMLPNRFPDHGEEPEYNSVDASLWFVVAVHDFLKAAAQAGRMIEPRECEFLKNAVEEIVSGFSAGTRYRIKPDADGLLSAGEPGVQLTWMDAKVGDWVVTPRIGKPVEIQALWLNALWIANQFRPGRWQDALERGRASFAARFWNEQHGCLYDVVDVDHVSGRLDPAVRPNQIFAIGGLPLQVLEGERARKVVTQVEQMLLTPLGLRSLAPGERDYRPRYQGGVWERDGSYHQGTVWPWLIGPFVEAWVRVHGNTPETRRLARERFLSPFREHLDQAGLGHISEIADADAPHTPRGCPWQAWSVGELLRLEYSVLADVTAGKPARRQAKPAPRSAEVELTAV